MVAGASCVQILLAAASWRSLLLHMPAVVAVGIASACHSNVATVVAATAATLAILWQRRRGGVHSICVIKLKGRHRNGRR